LIDLFPDCVLLIAHCWKNPAIDERIPAAPSRYGKRPLDTLLQREITEYLNSEP
jgi:hypothetical protein